MTIGSDYESSCGHSTQQRTELEVSGMINWLKCQSVSLPISGQRRKPVLIDPS